MKQDTRWLGDGNSTAEINGRRTDIAQIAGDLDTIIVETYEEGLGETVPGEINDELRTLIAHMHVSERLLRELMDSVSEDLDLRR